MPVSRRGVFGNDVYSSDLRSWAFGPDSINGAVYALLQLGIRGTAIFIQQMNLMGATFVAVSL